MITSKTMSTNNPIPHHRRSKRRSRRSAKKRSLLTQVFKWAGKNPIKIIALLFGIILIYITILFIQYASEQTRSDPGTLKVESK